MKRLRDRYCIQLVRLMFYTADSTSVRLMLGVASFWYAVFLVWPNAGIGTINHVREWIGLVPTMPGPPLLERPAYALMALMPGGVWTWSALFMLHFIGVHWRILDPVERVRWGIAVNAFGVFIWAYSTASLNISLGTVLPGTALEWTMVAFGCWALYRTGLTREMVTA